MNINQKEKQGKTFITTAHYKDCHFDNKLFIVPSLSLDSICL